VEPLRPAPFGCLRCFGSDPAAAWTALRAEQVGVLIHESHFGVQLLACDCGQHFAQVFTERIDWHGGEDDQTWLALPIRAGEVAELTACGEAEVTRLLGRFGQGRRFLLRTFPTGGELGVWWRQDGFEIGPHD